MTTNALEAEFRAFLKGTLVLSLDEFISELRLPDAFAERLGNMNYEDVDKSLAHLRQQPGLASYPLHGTSLPAQGIERLRKRASVQKRSELWDWEKVLYGVAKQADWDGYQALIREAEALLHMKEVMGLKIKL